MNTLALPEGELFGELLFDCFEELEGVVLTKPVL